VRNVIVLVKGDSVGMKHTTPTYWYSIRKLLKPDSPPTLIPTPSGIVRGVSPRCEKMETKSDAKELK
jgi:hypothetical protein